MKRFIFLFMMLVMTVLHVGAQVEGETNLATGATATALASEDAGRGPGQAIDDNHEGTNWSGNVDGHTNDNYWQLQFSAATTFNRIRINYNNQAPLSAKLQYSDDGETWTDIMEVGKNHGNADNDKAYFYKFEAKTATYIRIQCVQGCAEGWGIGFNDFAVYNSTPYIKTISTNITSVAVSSNTEIQLSAYDQFGEDYTNYTLTGSGTGVVLNDVPNPITTNPVTFHLVTGGGTSDITLTATDKTDNSKTATTNLTAISPVLTSISFIGAQTGKNDFLKAGDYVQFLPYDQFGHLILGTTVTLTEGATMGALGTDGDTKTLSINDDATGGKITVTVTKDEHTVTKSWYILGNGIAAPGIPTNIYKPIFSNGNTSYNGNTSWQTAWGKGSTAGDLITLSNGQVLKHIKNCGTISVGNNKDPFAGDAISINPSTLGFKELHVKLFAAQDITGYIYDERTVNQAYSLTAGTWTDVVVDVSAITDFHVLMIKTDQIDGSYPDVLIANVYFTKNSTDNDRPSFATGYPELASYDRTTATIKLKGSDPTSSNLHYILTDVSSGKLYGYIEATNDEEISHVLTGLAPETDYSIKVQLYDEAGNECETAPVRNFTTPATAIKEVRGTVDKETGDEKDIAEQIFAMGATTTTNLPEFTLIDEDGNVLDKSLVDIKYFALSNDYEILNTTGLSTASVGGSEAFVAPYSTTGIFNLASNKTGSAIVRILATYKEKSVMGHYGVSIYDPNLTITFKVDGTTYGPVNGTNGQLEELINNELTTKSVTGDYLSVTDLTVTGTLNSIDLRTIREMGGVKFNNTNNTKGFTEEQMAAMPYYFENGKEDEVNKFRGEHGVIESGAGAHGKLTKLDLANATFTLAPEKSFTDAEVETKYNTLHGAGAYASLTDDKKAAAKTEFNREDNILVTLPVEVEGGKHVGYNWYNTGNLYNITQFAFLGCVNLEEVTLPNHNGIYIGQHAFEYCENLKTVNNLDLVHYFDAFCFNQDKSLEGGTSQSGNTTNTVEISSSCMRIGYAAFQSCENLKLYSRHLPDNINFIGDLAFAGCKGLDSYIVYPNNPADDVAHMASGVFQNCTNLTAIYVPSTTVTFGYVEFQNCESLAAVHFYNAANPSWTNDNVANEKPTDIDDHDYSNNLLNVIRSAFEGCRSLEDESFQRLHEVKLIGQAAFSECYKLSSESFNILIKNFTDGQDGNNKDASGVAKVKSHDASLDDRNLDDHILPANAFSGCSALTVADLTQCTNGRILSIDDEVFNLCTSLKEVKLPATLISGDDPKGVKGLGDRVFQYCASLEKVYVNNPVAPTMKHNELTYTETEIRNGVDTEVEKNAYIFQQFNNNDHLNQIEIVFTNEMKDASDASTGYLTYRANKHFMEAMKRSMNENDAQYEIPAQFGADVTLTRTIGANKWNTFVMPFALQNNANRTNHQANVLTTALGAGSKVAAYRGLRDNQVFMFLRYKTTEDDNANLIKAFQPVIVYTTSEVKELRFTDVDVNFDDAGNAIAPATLNAEAANATYGYTGEVNEAVTTETTSNGDSEFDLLNTTTKTDFKFIGTFKPIYSVGYENAANPGVLAADKIIAENDYIIQSNKFYKVTNPSADRRYTLKGFRGWFKAGTYGGGSAKPATIMIKAIDWDEEGNVADEIALIDAATGEQIQPQDIYTVNGQLVRREALTADGLAKGVYIMGGKKIVIK